MKGQAGTVQNSRKTGKKAGNFRADPERSLDRQKDHERKAGIEAEKPPKSRQPRDQNRPAQKDQERGRLESAQKPPTSRKNHQSRGGIFASKKTAKG